MAFRGEVYPLAVRSGQRRGESLVDLDLGWDGIQKAAWSWLWERRQEVLVRIRILGFTLYTLRYGSEPIRDLFGRAFGDCPFSWEEGPRA